MPIIYRVARGLLLLLVASSMGCRAALSQAASGETVMPSPTAGATPEGPGVEEQPIVLGSGWAGAHVSDAPPGTTYAYVHYPQGAIQYDEVVVDDLLLDVQYVCYDRVRPLFSWFEPVGDATSVEKRYASPPMRFVQQGCQIVFVVDNAVGDTIGIRFKAHCPQCVH